MFRVLLWKLGFEVANLRRILENASKKVEGKTQNYFAFGANLDPQVLLQRKIRPLSAEEFVLKGYELSFSHPGPFEGMGFASIEKSSRPEARVYGKIYQLSDLDAKRMDYYELVPFLNRYKRVELKQAGREFFFYQSACPEAGLKPTRKYLEMITNGYKLSKLIPEEELRALSGVETIQNTTVRGDLRFLLKASGKYSDWQMAYDKWALNMFLKHFKNSHWFAGRIKI